MYIHDESAHNTFEKKLQGSQIIFRTGNLRE